MRNLGRFEIRSLLDQGGMGVVYRAFDPRLEREVALKVLRPDLLASESARKHFEREALAATRLNHPGLCPVYEVSAIGGQPYVVMPLLAGETLAARIARETAQDLPPVDRRRVDEVIEIIEQVARALDHAHQAGLVHRDIKPGNILIQTDGAPIVLDFGLAHDTMRDATMATGSDQLPGTPLYMAPEQLSLAASELDARVDIYALGITLYEALTLSPPFSGRSLFELFAQIKSHPTPDPRTLNTAVSRELQVIIAVATEKEPAHRYASCADFAEDLRRVRNGQPILARPAPRLARAMRWLRHNRAAAVAIAVLATGFAVTATMWAQNATLSNELADLAESEAGHRQQADDLRGLATRRLEQFDLLALDLRIEQHRTAVRELRPAWPAVSAGLRAWLEQVDTEFRPALERVDGALARLRKLANGTPPAPTGAAVKPSPRAKPLQRLKARRTALRAANEVREGRRNFEPHEIVADHPVAIGKIMRAALRDTMRFCGPERPPGFYGQEREQLARVTYALDEPDSIDAPRHGLLALQAWALLANGLDERAQSTMAQAVALAPAGERADFEWQQQRLDRTRREAAAELELVERLCRELEPIASVPTSLQFEAATDFVLFEALLRIRGQLFDLLRPGGLASRVEQSTRWSEALNELTEHHPNARVSWADARVALTKADGVVASELYAAAPIELEPQPGLVPIGMNPQTRLWEFYHLRSAVREPDPAAARQLEIPRHRGDGSIAMGAETGIVFVLVPGGMTTIGSQDRDPNGPNYSASRDRNETMMTSQVEPYFLARHELTQEQARRLFSSQDPLSQIEMPFSCRAGTIAHGRWISGRHPAEGFDWLDCMSMLTPHGLTLPTAWQWEHACRAGQPLDYSCGSDAASLEGYANVLDASTVKLTTWPGERADFHDGYQEHAPVGTYLANPFGLFDVHGNVAEFILTSYRVGQSYVTTRGGSAQMAASYARSARRLSFTMDGRSGDVGMRVCRTLR